MSDKPMLSPGIDKRITEDWAREFPGLGVYRPRWLMRRVGPLLVGVCLDRDSGGEKYKPCFHVHFLGKEFPVVSLTLCTQLRAKSGGPDYVEVRWHDEKYEDAVSRIIDQSPLPLEGALSLQQVLEAYRNHVETPLGRRQKAILLGDCILLLSWCGRKADALRLLNEVLSSTPEEAGYRSFGGREAYEQMMQVAIDNPDTINRIIELESKKLEVIDLPTSELVCCIDPSNHD